VPYDSATRILSAMRSISVIARLALLLAALSLVIATGTAQAAASDPAVAQVQTLNEALLKSMRAGSAQSMSERYRSLEPVIEQVFALPLITRLAVGPDWARFSPEEQKAVVAAFTRFTIASYAHNFRDFDGQKFELDENAATRGQDRIVRTRLIPAHDVPVSLLYRMHEVDGAWKVIDVYSNGVSELAVRRTDFAAALAAGGAPVLIAHLNKASDGLMK
jgi:phospholipid transport system substrate-binding protein